MIESPFSEEAGGGGLTVTEGSIWGFSGSTPPPPGSSFLTWVMTESMMMAVLPAWGEAEDKKTPLTRAAPSSPLLSGRIQTSILVHISTSSQRHSAAQEERRGLLGVQEKSPKGKTGPNQEATTPKMLGSMGNCGSAVPRWWRRRHPGLGPVTTIVQERGLNMDT